jgi:hypothetical protein
MWENILNLAMSNGLWAVLFLGLLIYELKDSSIREKKYQSTIEKLSESLSVVNEIKYTVDDISQNVKKSKKEKMISEKA